MKKPEGDKPKETKFEAAYDSIAEVLPDILYVMDMDGYLVRWNKATEKLTGYSSEELSKMHVLDVFPEEDRKGLAEELVRLFKEGKGNGAAGLLTKDGKLIPVAWNAAVLKNSKGDIIGLTGILRDITELKRAEEERAKAVEKVKRETIEESVALLEQRAKKLTDSRTAMIHMLKSLDKTSKELAAAREYTDNIIESMVDALIVVGPDFKIKTINKATSDLLGYEEDELIGKLVATIFAEEEEEEDSIFKGTRLKKLIEEGAVRDYDMEYRTKKGGMIPVSFSGSVMRDKEGELVGIVGIAHDMREIERLMAEEKEFAAERAKAEERGRLALGLHDDLAQSLASLVLKADLLRSRLPPSREKIDKEVFHLRELGSKTLRDLRELMLQLKASQSRELDLTPTLRRYIKNFIRTYRIPTELKIKGKSKKFPSDWAFSVLSIIREAFNNIARHAHASRASVRLEFKSDKLEIMIEDNGRGFDLQRVQQGMASGSKLGLAGMQERAKQLRGELTITTALGEGTKIEATIPYA